MFKQTVRIINYNNGVTKVEAVSGAQIGAELFIDGELGTKGERVKVPEFRVEDFESETAKKYYAEKNSSEIFLYSLRDSQRVIERTQGETATEALEKFFPHGYRVTFQFHGMLVVQAKSEDKAKFTGTFGLTWIKFEDA